MKSKDEKKRLIEDGYVILNGIFNSDEINEISGIIENFNQIRIRLSGDIYAIRAIMKQIPSLKEVVLNQKIKDIVRDYFGNDFFLVRSIYFNKPSSSNWFVSWHQDISIHAEKRADHDGFLNWTKKGDHIGVQPPTDILASTFTIRIHLDDCDDTNGALKVISGSHLQGISRFKPGQISAVAATCPVLKGGMMIMKPLLFHASGKNISNKNRRVLHMEFCNKELPAAIGWAEKQLLF